MRRRFLFPEKYPTDKLIKFICAFAITVALAESAVAFDYLGLPVYDAKGNVTDPGRRFWGIQPGPDQSLTLNYSFGLEGQMFNLIDLKTQAVIKPNALESTEITIGDQNEISKAIATWNFYAEQAFHLDPNIPYVPFPNVSALNVATRNGFDLQSDALHEIGHALGLNHPNQGGGTGLDNYFAAHTPANQAIDPGADKIPGTQDDVVPKGVELRNLDLAGSTDQFKSSAAVDWTPASVVVGADGKPQRNYNVPGGIIEAAMVQGAVRNEAQWSPTQDDIYGLAGLEAGPTANMGDDFQFVLQAAAQGIIPQINFYEVPDLLFLQGPNGQTRGLNNISSPGTPFLEVLLDQSFDGSLTSLTEIWYTDSTSQQIAEADIFFSMNPSPIPEPSTLYLLAGGLALLLACGRRRLEDQ